MTAFKFVGVPSVDNDVLYNIFIHAVHKVDKLKQINILFSIKFSDNKYCNFFPQ